MTETGQAFSKTFPVDTARLKRLVIENPFGTTYVRGWQQSDIRFAAEDARWDGTGLVIDETEEDMIISTAGLAGRFAVSASWLGNLSSVTPNIASIFEFNRPQDEATKAARARDSEELRRRAMDEMRRAREEMREARRMFRKAWEDARAKATAQNEYVSAQSDFDNPDDDMPDPDDFSVRGGQTRRSGVDFFDSQAFQGVFDSVKQGFNDIGNVFGEIGTSLGSWGAKVGEGFNAPLVIDAPAGIEIIIRSISGDVRIENWDGRIQIDSVSSGAKLSKIGGDVKFASLSGDLKIEDMSAILVARDTSGRIRVRRSNLKGFGVYTTSGNVTLETSLAPGGKYEIGSVSGQTKAFFPANQQCTIESRTVSGKVTPIGNNFGSSFSLGGAGKKKATGSDTQSLHINGGGYALVQFRSVSGDFKIGVGNPGSDVESAFRDETDDSPANRESAPPPTSATPPRPIFTPAPQPPTYRTQPVGTPKPVTPPPPVRTQPQGEMPMPGPYVPQPSPNPTPMPMPPLDPSDPQPIPIPPERPIPPLVPSEPPRENKAESQKSVLQALERGEIDTNEAMRRLSGLDSAQG